MLALIRVTDEGISRLKQQIKFLRQLGLSRFQFVQGWRQRDIIGYQQSPTVGEGLDLTSHLVDENNLLSLTELCTQNNNHRENGDEG